MAKPDPSYAPMYCAMYPDLAQIAKTHGYAMAVHGSLARDFDLICIPWVEKPSDPEVVVKAIVNEFALMEIGTPETRVHGREIHTLSIGFGECFLDLSFMPVLTGETSVN
ncbi:hypothetical protein NTE19_003342 [Vibrio fluvialis]|nr:hypothetical protein [Vibrio fluvialis]